MFYIINNKFGNMENFLYFYLYFLLCGCGLAVILARNPVQSVLFLILVFLLVAFIFMLLGAEFLAILLIIVYVGAISILFLFVVMMLNLRVVELHSTFYNYFPISILIGLLFFVEICYFLIIDFGNLTLSKFQGSNALFLWITILEIKSNLQLMGIILYNYYNYIVIVASFLLLTSMICTIVVTLGSEYRIEPRKNQNLYSFVRLNLKPIRLWNYKYFTWPLKLFKIW